MGYPEDYRHRPMTHEEAQRFGHVMSRDQNDNVFHEYTDENGQVVRQYDFDENVVTVTPGAHADYNTVVSLIHGLAEQRLNSQLGYVHSAVLQFQGHATQQINQWVHDNAPAATIGWGSLVEGLVSGVLLVWAPEAEAVKAAFEYLASQAVHAFSAGLEVAIENEAAKFDHAKMQLENGVAKLVEETTARYPHAIDAAKASIEAVVHAGMEEYRAGPFTTDSGWIEELTHYFGFPDPHESSVTGPILAQLNHHFGEILAQVNAQAHGH